MLISNSSLSQAYDKSLVQALYVLVRAGKLYEALELCQKAQQPWRAASIRGTLVFQWRGLSGVFVPCYDF